MYFIIGCIIKIQKSTQIFEYNINNNNIIEQFNIFLNIFIFIEIIKILI